MRGGARATADVRSSPSTRHGTQETEVFVMRRWRAFSLMVVLAAGLAAPGRLCAQAPAPPGAPAALDVAPAAVNPTGTGFHYFSFLSDPQYSALEKAALWVV